MRVSGKIEIRATALEPIHHGAGISGNTSLLRMQSIITPDGEQARVPFISGNSIKHRIRYHAVQYALDVLGVEDGSMSKAEVDILFTGGHLSKAGGSIDLEKSRRIERLFPALSMCGYSAGNCMTESKLRVSHLHLVCQENAWRLPEDLRGTPTAALRSGAQRSEEFGTRHDKSTSQVAVRMLEAAEAAEVASRRAKKLTGELEPGKDRDSAQMIYDFQVISAGASFFGTVAFRDLTDLEQAALASAFYYGSAGDHGDRTLMHVGAKASIGFGTISVDLRGAIRVPASAFEPSEAIVGKEGASQAEAYRSHLRDHKDEILSTIREAVQ